MGRGISVAVRVCGGCAQRFRSRRRVRDGDRGFRSRSGWGVWGFNERVSI
ncbi:hypothetical protein CASFOL_042850 [Castilleja foliolosa]|uniref:Uncharacterized protein n=1 Tax=Castilleja foliolosa TaxID=1961234 RepID=A0ABD3B7K1_9LAMI